MPVCVRPGVQVPRPRHRLLGASHPHLEYRLRSGDYYLGISKAGIILLDTETVSIYTVSPRPAELGKLALERIDGRM